MRGAQWLRHLSPSSPGTPQATATSSQPTLSARICAFDSRTATPSRFLSVRLGLADATDVRADPEDSTKVAAVLGREPVDIDWMQVRAASDPAFAKELRRRDSDEARRVGRRLKALREDRRLRQDVVAEQVGMTPPQLSKIERGQSDLRISTVRALLRVMNASFADIAGPDFPGGFACRDRQGWTQGRGACAT